MGDRPILYAKAGGPPGNWRSLRVVHKANGREVKDVLEANAHEGWYVARVRGADGRFAKNSRGDAVLTKRVQAAIRIEVRPRP